MSGGWPPEDLERVGGCPVCGAANRGVLHAELEDRLFGAPGRWTLWHCAGCPTAYLDPRPSAASIARAYASYFWHEPPEDRERAPVGLVQRARRAGRNAYLNRALGYRLRPAPPALGVAVGAVPGFGPALERWVRHLRGDLDAPRLLDVGCASGEFLLQMRHLGWSAHGIDIDDAALAQARRAGLDVAHGTLEAPSATAAAGSFDAVTLNHVIEHLPAPVAALRRATALLRPGGVLWVATPNLRSLVHRMFGEDWLSLDPPRHLVLFSAASLRDAFWQAGLLTLEQPAPVRNLHVAVAQSAALAAGGSVEEPGRPAPRLRLLGVLGNTVARHHPDVSEELVLLGRRP